MNKQKRVDVYAKYNGCCAYCGEKLTIKQMQVDHITAKVKGGTDEIENLNPSCRQCNFYKDTFSVEGFRERLSTIIERVRKPFIVRLAEKYGLISFNKIDIKFHFEHR